MYLDRDLKIIILLAISLLLLSGCKTMPVDNEIKPALLESLSAEQAIILNETISKALNGRKVTLAKDAFTESNKVTLEQATLDPIGMQGMHGRIQGKPESPTFMLFLKGNNCYLVYEKTGQEIPLENITCKSM